MPCDTWLYNAPSYPVFEDCTAISTVRLTPGNPDHQGVMRQTNMCDVWRTTGVDVSVTLDEGVQAIYHRSFRDAVRLKSIKLPNSLLVIGDGAFMGCTGLTTIDVPNSVETIGEGAFSGCTGLTSFVWPEPANTAKMTAVAQQMFMDCTNLASITLPARVHEIHSSAFLRCSNLRDVYYLGTREQKENMLIRSSNGPLNDATWHFVEPALTILTQPRNVTVKSGVRGTCSIRMKQTEVSYQWYTRLDENEAWTLMDGETRATLSVVGARANNGSQYYCRVENMIGDHIDSDIVNLTVTLQPPVIKTQPKAMVTVKSGAKARISVKATGPNLKYQWYKLANGAEDWEAMDGQTKADCTFVATLADNGAQFRCRVWNDDDEQTSGAATLTVTPVPPKFSTHPRGATVNAGTTVTFKAKASGTNVTYQWYVKKTADGDWEPVDGETGLALTVVAAAEMNGWQFRCTATADGFTADSKIATLKLR